MVPSESAPPRTGVDLVRSCSLSRGRIPAHPWQVRVHHGPDTESPRNGCRFRERRVDLELAETRTFSSRVVYFRYRVARQPTGPPSQPLDQLRERGVAEQPGQSPGVEEDGPVPVADAPVGDAGDQPGQGE